MTKQLINNSKDSKNRNYFITWYPSESETLEDVKQRVLDFGKHYDGFNCIIGSMELTQEGLKHTHVLLAFKNAISFEMILSNFAPHHVEVCRNLRASKVYSTKEGCFYSSFPVVGSGKEDIYVDFMTDLVLGLTIKELMAKYPSLFIRHFNNVMSLIDHYRLGPDDK